MKTKIARCVLAVAVLVIQSGCGKKDSGYRSLSSEGAIKKINKDNKK
jgi:hypothetical protein